MSTRELRNLFNKHCRFKLRSGREVFGVIWEVKSDAGDRLYFASVQDYRLAQQDPGAVVHAINVTAEDIVWAENLAS